MSELLKKLAVVMVISGTALAVGVMVATKEKKKPTVRLSVDAAVSGKLFPDSVTPSASNSTAEAVRDSEAPTSAQPQGSTPAAVVAQSSLAGLSDLEQAQISDFSTWADKVLSELPQITELAPDEDPSESVEGSTEALREGAADVAELYDYVDKNPVTKPAGMLVFKNCATNGKLLDPIRAYCYAKAVRLGLELGEEFWDSSAVSDEIKNLSRDL